MTYRNHDVIEGPQHDVWLTAYLYALTSGTPHQAHIYASDALNRYLRKWSVDGTGKQDEEDDDRLQGLTHRRADQRE